jgi:beta-fructofuranosidase
MEDPIQQIPGERGINMSEEITHEALLRKADEEIAKVVNRASACHHRLGYHIMAPAYWMNDPNGLIQFKGDYHVFYQHHPYSADWGPMHWGHVKSKDLVHWEQLPISLAPSEEYDGGGCFSGSAVNNNGALTLIYTGITRESEKQVQCIATSLDGRTFLKYAGNPIISEPPTDGSEDFRDPKVWKYEESWYMVVGSSKNKKGKALFYQSSDLVTWTYRGVAAESDGTQGEVWECPDIFSLGAKDFLLFSPFNREDNRKLYGRVTYLAGRMDYHKGSFISTSSQPVDYGFDFYAAQTFLDDHGRRIMIGWMDSWDGIRPTRENGWSCTMSVPRILTVLPNGSLNVAPVPELKALRGRKHEYSSVKITAASSSILGHLKGECLEIIVEFDIQKTKATEFGLVLRQSDDGKEGTWVICNTEKKELRVDRNLSGKNHSGVSSCPLEAESEQKISLHIFLDRSSIEVFGNGGQVVMSNRIYPEPSSLGMDLFAKDGVAIASSFEAWELKDIWK